MYKSKITVYSKYFDGICFSRLLPTNQKLSDFWTYLYYILLYVKPTFKKIHNHTNNFIQTNPYSIIV